MHCFKLWWTIRGKQSLIKFKKSFSIRLTSKAVFAIPENPLESKTNAQVPWSTGGVITLVIEDSLGSLELGLCFGPNIGSPSQLQSVHVQNSPGRFLNMLIFRPHSHPPPLYSSFLLFPPSPFLNFWFSASGQRSGECVFYWLLGGCDGQRCRDSLLQALYSHMGGVGILRKPKAKEAVLQISNGSQLHFIIK